jgi:hypothetical protein
MEVLVVVLEFLATDQTVLFQVLVGQAVPVVVEEALLLLDIMVEPAVTA